MCNKALRDGFGVYFDPSKSTSGQRFFEDLCRVLAKEAIPLDQRPAAILFNISAPIKAIIKAKLCRQKIVLRVDGLYSDRLSPAFLATFKWPLRHVLSMGLRYPWTHDFLALLANLIKHNYSAFARILISDGIIYQSKFSKKVHNRYLSNKPYVVIVNGSVYQSEKKSSRVLVDNEEIRLVTIYDEWRPSKRIHDLVEFVRWTRENKKIPMRLIILGYTTRVPACISRKVKSIIETAPYIRTLPRFQSFTGEVRDALLDSDVYITFTYRDACPNAVVEALAHGLPVVGVASGGVPEIVGDAGILIPGDDFSEGFFSPHRYECNFPKIDFEQVLDAVLTVASKRTIFQARVQKRFTTDLGINIVAERYAAAMRSLVDTGVTIEVKRGLSCE